MPTRRAHVTSPGIRPNEPPGGNHGYATNNIIAQGTPRSSTESSLSCSKSKTPPVKHFSQSTRGNYGRTDNPFVYPSSPYLEASIAARFPNARRSPPRTRGSLRPSSAAHSAHRGRPVCARSRDRRFHQRPRRCNVYLRATTGPQKQKRRGQGRTDRKPHVTRIIYIRTIVVLKGRAGHGQMLLSYNSTVAIAVAAEKKRFGRGMKKKRQTQQAAGG